jgi:MerR family transcriptional regulator, heat shock protein HspR
MRMNPQQPLFTIGTVAKLLQLHEQTIRQYERLGLVLPSRTARHTRMYSQADVERLECVTYLVKNCRVNIAGVRLMVQFGVTRPEIEHFLKAQARLKDLESMSRNLLPPGQEDQDATQREEIVVPRKIPRNVPSEIPRTGRRTGGRRK